MSLVCNKVNVHRVLFYFHPNLAENHHEGIMTSTVDIKDETRTRPIQKAKVNVLPMASGYTFSSLFGGLFSYTLILYYNAQIEILLGKTEKFDELMAAAAEEREANGAEEQS